MAGQALRVIEQLRPENGPPLSLDLPEGLSFEEWKEIGRKLCIGSQAINWHIGDWWAYGDHHYGDRAKLSAEGIFGKEFQTLMNLASVARKFEPSRRREVPFSHHVEVAALPAETADELLERAEREQLSSRDLRREVQVIKAANDPAVGAVVVSEPAERRQRPEWLDAELVESYARYVEAMERLQEFVELTVREADYLAFCLDRLGEAHANCEPVPTDFEVRFRELGRLAMESEYRVSRITVTRWLRECGFRRLIDERANFVRMERNKAKGQMPLHADDARPEDDMLLPIARQAAQHLRVSRWGGHRVSQCETGGWYVGTAFRTSEELIVMAERVGFNRQHAAAEAEREGY